MSRILLIETATQVCSVALAEDSKLISLKETRVPNAHSQKLMPFIDEIIKDAGIKPGDLNAVAVSKGPGSYTGLRIGVSAAKGLCYSLDIPLIAINTLESMAYGMREKYITAPGFYLFCPMIDARRMEVYYAVFCRKMYEIRETQAAIIEKSTFDSLLHSYKTIFFGSGAPKCKEVIKHENAIFEDGFQPSARYMADQAEEIYEAQDFADTAYFEPFYLKNFIPGEPKVKGL